MIIGSKDDISLAEDVVKASGGKGISIAGQTDIKELISIIRGCSFMVSNDTGPMHIAAAYVIPVVAIFGPANPARTGPYGDKHVIVKSDIACAPCYKKKCKDIKCMEGISVQQVYKAIETVMNNE
jgi:ADP-heptose:LPS heptosyltransferase